MKLLLILSTLLISVAAKAQTPNTTVPIVKEIPADSVKKIKEPVGFTASDHPPQFPGGHEQFVKYLIANMHYPQDSYNKKIQGRVLLIMMVEMDGTVNDVKVIKGVAEDIGKEAIRVLSNSPKWIPGVQKGKLVRVKYAVPLNFAL